MRLAHFSPPREANTECNLRKLLLSFFTIFSLLFPHLLYSDEGKQRAPLWKVFCAHWVMLGATSNEAGLPVAFDSQGWQQLVRDLDNRTMPAGFAPDETNLDAWLRCENEFGARFDAAEFFSKGADYFSVASVSGTGELNPVALSLPAQLYSRKWTEFLQSLQKQVTTPDTGHTILLRAGR